MKDFLEEVKDLISNTKNDLETNRELDEKNMKDLLLISLLEEE